VINIKVLDAKKMGGRCAHMAYMNNTEGKPKIKEC
jgi:hypothetical protein